MPITTIKHCQSDPDWWFTVEDRDIEISPEPGSGLTVTYYEARREEGQAELRVGLADALLIRDAINQLYPPNQ